MWTYSTFKQLITHFFRIFNQTWQNSYGGTVQHLFLKVRTWKKLRKLNAKILKKIEKNNTDVYLWAYSFQSPSIMFWVISDQKDFVTQIKIIWCDTILGNFNGQLFWQSLGRRGPSSAWLFSTSTTTPWQISEVSRHFYIFNKSDLVGTLTKLPLPDVFWCDTFFIKMQKKFYFFVIITCKSMLLCHS